MSGRNFLVFALIIICRSYGNTQQITPDMEKLNKLLQQDKGSCSGKSMYPNDKTTFHNIPPHYADTLQPAFENQLGKVYILQTKQNHTIQKKKHSTGLCLMAN